MSGNSSVVVLVVTGIPSEFVIVTIDNVIQDGSSWVPAISRVSSGGRQWRRNRQIIALEM